MFFVIYKYFIVNNLYNLWKKLLSKLVINGILIVKSVEF